MVRIRQKDMEAGASLGVQWLRLRLPVQRVQTQPLVRELRPQRLVAKTPDTEPKQYYNKVQKRLLKWSTSIQKKK